MNLIKLINLVLCLIHGVLSKYVEGEIKTRENWAFLTRFCFLSEDGEFEYRIEYNEQDGNPNLLLYYDTDDQWPAVYKTNKTCYQKEAVLNVEQNQVINLTVENPKYMDFAGCTVAHSVTTTEGPKRTVKVPPKNRQNSGPQLRVPQRHPRNQETRSLRPPRNFYEPRNFRYFDRRKFRRKLHRSRRNGIFGRRKSRIDCHARIGIGPREGADQKEGGPPNPAYNVIYRNRVIICRNARRFRSSRERWWFVAVSNCNGTKGINIKYRILMTNGPHGDYWHEHFSADQFYILPVLLAFSVAYSFLMLAILICTVELKSRQLLHSTYKLFVLSAIIQFFGIVIQCAAYLKYAANGMGAPNAKTFGSMFTSYSETCFLLLLLLLAKGYTVTRGRLPLSASVKLTIFMCLYSVTYICIFVYEAKVFDPGEVLYLYESPAGYGLIILRIIAWLMFIYSTVFTLKHYPEKSNFYYPFNICGTLWFIAGPAFILSANTYIDKWVRESVVCAVLLFISFGGHLMFLLLTMPSMANKNFPYHVRTSQIGIMELTGAAGASTIEHFGHHVYEPSSDPTDQTVIIPLTRRTEEIFGGLYAQHLQTQFTRTIQRDVPAVPNDNAQNIAMQNVLTWSMAKNCPALEGPDFDRKNRSSIGSDNTHYSEGFSPSEQAEAPSNNSTITHNHLNEPPNNNYEYVKDVPVELFTISKFITKTANINTNETEK